MISDKKKVKESATVEDEHGNEYEVEVLEGMFVPSGPIFAFPMRFYQLVEQVASDMDPRSSQFASGPWTTVRVTDESGDSAEWGTIYPNHEQTVTDWKGDEYTLSRTVYALTLGAASASAYNGVLFQKAQSEGRRFPEAGEQSGEAYRMLQRAGASLDRDVVAILD